MGDKVTISVHERLDEPGYIVKVAERQRVANLPVDDGLAEAEALAQSVRAYVEAGCPIEALLGDGDEPQPVEISDGCPRCGCGDVDAFTWEDQGAQVMCDRCGKCYLPCDSPENEEVAP